MTFRHYQPFSFLFGIFLILRLFKIVFLGFNLAFLKLKQNYCFNLPTFQQALDLFVFIGELLLRILAHKFFIKVLHTPTIYRFGEGISEFKNHKRRLALGTIL